MNKNPDDIEMTFDGKSYSAEELDRYGKNYSESGLFDKIKGGVKKAGLKIIYEALQLYYVAQKPNCPTKVKAAIYGALGMFILPLDLVPDFIPVLGYTDDAAAIAFALLMAQMFIDDEVKAMARARIDSIFGEGASSSLN